MSHSPPIVLTFAASDPTGGAGLQADLLTLAGMGCHPLSVVTALTMQDTRGVERVLAVQADWVAGQARHLLEDMRVAAFKLGVFGSLENIRTIADVISDYPEVPVILDPVLASGRGDALASDEMIGALRELIVPQCTVVTPNSLEARRLAASGDDADEIELAACARRLLALGCEYVLVTGTHEASAEVVNTLYAGGAVVRGERRAARDVAGRARGRCRAFAVPQGEARRSGGKGGRAPCQTPRRAGHRERRCRARARGECRRRPSGARRW